MLGYRLAFHGINNGMNTSNIPPGNAHAELVTSADIQPVLTAPPSDVLGQTSSPSSFLTTIIGDKYVQNGDKFIPFVD